MVIETSTHSADEVLEHFMEGLKRRNPGEHEFHQAVHCET